MGRNLLPTRPAPSTQKPTFSPDGGGSVLEGANLIDFARVGGAEVSPDGELACFSVRQYDWGAKKFDAQLWIADLAAAKTMSDEQLVAHAHLTQLTAGSQHKFSGASNPQWSPCGRFVAFLSDRGGDKTNGTAVWIVPARGPGEARLLASFAIPVGDLEWNHGAGGIVVSAAVYVDLDDGSGSTSVMEATAARDKALKDGEALGGLDAVVFKRLPIRQWDAWLDAKMPHPFFLKIEQDSSTPSGYRASDQPPVDLISGVPTAVPSGAFGGSEDWAISKDGLVAVSARPPLDAQEAWTTNRHIYLQRGLPTSVSKQGSTWAPGDDAALGECLTASNPGYDTNPTFSPDGSQLAWLTMAGADYEADAVGICLYDVASGQTRSLLRAELDWDYSPQNLHWSKDGSRLLFTADVRSRRALCSVDVAKGAAGGINILCPDHSNSLYGEATDGGLLVGVESFVLPQELFSLTKDGGDAKQLSYFNRQRVSGTALGRVGELTFTGPSGDEIQSWLIRPAGFSEDDEANPTKKYPLAVLYHGGPQVCDACNIRNAGNICGTGGSQV